MYDLGDTLAIVATDRISAFDWVMPTGIPGKGRLLTAMTPFWLDWLGRAESPPQRRRWPTCREPFRRQPDVFAGRTMLVRKTTVVPIECVARGYLAGSGWKEYRQTGTVCGIPLPAGLREARPAAGADLHPGDEGRERARREHLVRADGRRGRGRTRRPSCGTARSTSTAGRPSTPQARGIILADTKFEWGRLPAGEVILIDEVLTPDSSRFWPADTYRPGGSPPSFDKQFVRDWLETTGWDKNSPPPELPPDVVARTAAKYREALDRLIR